MAKVWDILNGNRYKEIIMNILELIKLDGK